MRLLRDCDCLLESEADLLSKQKDDLVREITKSVANGDQDASSASKE